MMLDPGSSLVLPERLGDTVMDQQAIIKKLSRVGILGNVLLSAFKLCAGIFGKSGAMVSDAVHSLSDVFATLIATVGVRLSQRQEDTEHPYGHERLESMASLILGVILAGTGLGIGYSGIRKIFFERAALETSFIGIGMARLGFPIMDPIASLIICVLILKVACDIIRDAVAQMLDTSCGKDYERTLRGFIEGQPGVEHVDLLHTRQFGNKVYVDLEIAVNRDLSLGEAHAIAERVHSSVEQRFPNIKHVMIHVNPWEP